MTNNKRRKIANAINEYYGTEQAIMLTSASRWSLAEFCLSREKQAVKEARAAVAYEIITAIEVYDTNDLNTVTSLYKYAVAILKETQGSK